MARTNKTSSKDPDKVFDVAKPGKSTPDATAKPVIVGHKSILKDPMVNSDQVTETDTSAEKLSDGGKSVSTTAPTIQPLGKEKETKDTSDKVTVKIKSTSKTEPEPNSTTAPETGKPAEEQETNDSQQLDTVPSEEKSGKTIAVSDDVASDENSGQKTESTNMEETSLPQESASVESAESEKSPNSNANNKEQPDKNIPPDHQTADTIPESSEASEVEAVVTQAGTKQEADKKAREQSEKDAAIEKLIEEKKYYAPIGEKKHRRTRMHIVMLLLLTLLLGLLLLNLLIEAEIIKTSIEPPINLLNR